MYRCPERFKTIVVLLLFYLLDSFVGFKILSKVYVMVDS